MAGFFLSLFGVKDRKLGVSDGKRRYDLPLSNSPGNGFLVLLIGLMSFLGVLALCAFFALGDITERWSSGLENQVTIEIPAEDANGAIRDFDAIGALQEDVKAVVEGMPFIRDHQVLDDKAVGDLIAPWLGEDFALDDVPLPGLISIELAGDHTVMMMDRLREKLLEVDASITLDTHDEWLSQILALIGTLEFGALLVGLVIAVTAVSAIAGAIRSRMAEHKPDVELLHLMGASDGYIARQFQRHAGVLGLQGGFAGLCAGALMLGLFAVLNGGNASGLIPEFAFSGVQIAVLAALPFAACILAAMAARFTVLRELGRMP